MNLQLILYNNITIIHNLASIRQIVVKFLIGVDKSSFLQGFSQKYQNKLFDTMCYGRILNMNVFINPSHCNKKVM